MTLYPFWKHLVYAAEAKGFSFSDHKCLQACDKKTFWIAQHQSYTKFCAITDEEMKAGSNMFEVDLCKKESSVN